MSVIQDSRGFDLSNGVEDPLERRDRIVFSVQMGRRRSVRLCVNYIGRDGNPGQGLRPEGDSARSKCGGLLSWQHFSDEVAPTKGRLLDDDIVLTQRSGGRLGRFERRTRGRRRRPKAGRRRSWTSDLDISHSRASIHLSWWTAALTPWPRLRRHQSARLQSAVISCSRTGSRAGGFWVSTLWDACVLCALVRRLMG